MNIGTVSSVGMSVNLLYLTLVKNVRCRKERYIFRVLLFSQIFENSTKTLF